VQDQQFIAQMAQLSSLEQMQNISTNVMQLADRQVYGLVGKFIMGVDSQTGQMQNGIAEAIIYDESNKPFVRVNGKAIAVKDVKVIADAGLMNTAKSENTQPNSSAAATNSEQALSAVNPNDIKSEKNKNDQSTDSKAGENLQDVKRKDIEEKKNNPEPVSYYDDDYNYSKGKISMSI
jgi:flagellar basal-body rod modification protein FlgD